MLNNGNNKNDNIPKQHLKNKNMTKMNISHTSKNKMEK
jgi:hypothetical protein